MDELYTHISLVNIWTAYMRMLKEFREMTVGKARNKEKWANKKEENRQMVKKNFEIKLALTTTDYKNVH